MFSAVYRKEIKKKNDYAISELFFFFFGAYQKLKKYRSADYLCIIDTSKRSLG